MNTRELVKNIITKQGGIAKSADFVAAGIRASSIVNLCNAGFLRRIRHGYYQLADQQTVSEAQIIASLLPEGIVCVESALFHYGYSEFTPRTWSIAVSRSISRTKLNIDFPPMHIYYMSSDLYELGKVKDDFDGVALSLYDRDRTICDCFKYRFRLDRELFNKALNSYADDGKKNLAHLSFYAKKLRVFGKVSEMMGVLLDGR